MMLLNKKKIRERKTGKQNNPALAVLLFLTAFIVAMILLPPAEANPQIMLLNQLDVIEYGSVQQITLEITADENSPSITNDTNITNTTSANNNTDASDIIITEVLIEFEGQNHTMQKEENSYSYVWLPQKGTITYRIYAKDSENESATYSSQFLVRDTIPPTISNLKPQGTLNYNIIEISLETNENATCKYDEINVSYDSMYYVLAGDGKTHSQLRTFPDGEHTIYVRCKDTSNNIGLPEKTAFTIDSSQPQITGISPTGTITQSQTQLRLATNEPARCRWGLVNTQYSSLAEEFQTTGSTLHEQPIILNEGINSYYLSCQDKAGNTNPATTLNIELNTAPTASINIETNESHKKIRQGTYSLTLTSSEALLQAPTLRLDYCLNSITIPLEGSSRSWKGYFIIPQGAGECIGEFAYRGTDLKGTAGTEITDGKIIMIDAVPPAKPSRPILMNENNRLRVSWEYQGEDTDHYNIYRSTTGNTGKNNLKATAEGTTYLDSDIINKIGYFYRISAVDEAGNEGELSEEEFLMTEQQNATIKFQQTPEALLAISASQTNIESKKRATESKIAELEKTKDPEMILLLSQTEIMTELNELLNGMQLLIGELKTYQETKIELGELRSKIASIDKKANEYSQNMISQITIKEVIETEQAQDPELARKAASEYLKNKMITDSQKKEYDLMILSLQDQVRIKQKISLFEISYEYNRKEKIMILEEQVITTKTGSGLIIHEIISGEGIKLSELSFGQAPEEINSLGAIWQLKNLPENKLVYKTEKDIDMAAAKKPSTVLLYDLEYALSQMASQSQDQMTGAVISETPASTIPILAVVIIAGIIALLLGYYFFLAKTEEKRVTDNRGSFNEAISSNHPLNEKISDFQEVLVILEDVERYLSIGDVAAASSRYAEALAQYRMLKCSLPQKMQLNLLFNSAYDKIQAPGSS